MLQFWFPLCRLTRLGLFSYIPNCAGELIVASRHASVRAHVCRPRQGDFRNAFNMLSVSRLHLIGSRSRFGQRLPKIVAIHSPGPIQTRSLLPTPLKTIWFTRASKRWMLEICKKSAQSLHYSVNGATETSFDTGVPRGGRAATPLPPPQNKTKK